MNTLIMCAMVIVIMSFGTSMVLGNSPAKAWKVVAWEIGKVWRLAKWLLKHLLRGIAALCHWAQGQL